MSESAAHEPANHVLDLPAFARLTGDPGLLPWLAAAFLKQWPQSLAGLQACTAQRDLTALKSQLHRLRGSCSMLAAPVAVAASERAERAIRDDAPEAAWHSLGQVHVELDRLVLQLQTNPAAQKQPDDTDRA